MAGPLETNPYRAPRSSTDTEELAASRSLPGFADQRNLVLLLTGLLGCQAISGALGAIVLVALFFFETGSASYAAFGLLSLRLATAHDALYYLTWIGPPPGRRAPCHGRSGDVGESADRSSRELSERESRRLSPTHRPEDAA